MLLERAELTAGSTWHAAGLLPLFNMSYTVGQLHKYSVDLYKRLPAETGQDVSFHVTGNLRLATCRDRMDEYQKYCGTANTIGVPFQVIGPKEVRDLWPLVELGDVLFWQGRYDEFLALLLEHKLNPDRMNMDNMGPLLHRVVTVRSNRRQCRRS